jgi:hypothetical protein
MLRTPPGWRLSPAAANVDSGPLCRRAACHCSGLSEDTMRIALAVIAAVALAGWSSVSSAADPSSDAPEARTSDEVRFTQAPTYRETLKLWRSVEDINAWIGARFEYDVPRAVQLSETQRQQNGRMPVFTPEEFFAVPRGVCVDLSRFAVETLRVVDPGTKPAYVMIEFDPVSIAGNTLRRHWVASFERNGKRYFFADSKRPGHIAGPYGSTQEFIAEYARYRGRQIVSFREMASYERKVRAMASKQPHGERP